MFKKFDERFLAKPQIFLFVFMIIALIATLQEYYGGFKGFQGSPSIYTHYNNYLIFKQSFFHLINGKDLYAFYLNEHWDLYKYSPTFALLFGAIAWHPDSVGLFTWNLLNALSLFFGVRMLSLTMRERNLVLLIATVELFTSLQNAQSNALITGLIILAFALMEKKKFFWACVLIAFTVYIKLFGLFAFAICLLYRERWRMVLYAAIAMVMLGVLPLAVMSVDQLIGSYSSWWKLLQSDYVPNPLSLIGVVKAWSGIELQKNMVLLAGVMLFAVPLIRMNYFSNSRFRMEFLAMILLWIVVFNHKAESPTFIIAMAGVALWFVSTGIEPRWRNLLAISAVLFTSLSATDLFPNFIQDNFFDPLSVKAIPCIVIYFVLLVEMTLRPAQLEKA